MPDAGINNGRLLNTNPNITKIQAEMNNVNKNITLIKEQIVEEEEALGGTFVRVNF